MQTSKPHLTGPPGVIAATQRDPDALTCYGEFHHVVGDAWYWLPDHRLRCEVSPEAQFRHNLYYGHFSDVRLVGYWGYVLRRS